MYAFSMIALVIFSLPWKAFVALKLWAWFVLPALGVAPPQFVLMIGLLLFVHLLAPSSSGNKKEESDSVKFVEQIAVSLLAPLFTLCIGWLLTLFV